MDLERAGQTSALPQRVLRTLDRVNAPSIVQRHPALRWLAPLAVAGVVGVVATGVFQASATSSPAELPETSAASLLADVQRPAVTGFSGTVVSRLSLGLPELPSFGAGSPSEDGSSLTSLLSGSHTLKVWYGGPAKERVALLGATDESDVFRSGRQLWQWSSADRTAVHLKLPKHTSGSDDAVRTREQSLTPAGLADDLLRTLDPSTEVTVSSGHRVANRDAYELVLTPRTTATRIGSVRVAIDGRTKMPLGVQIFARGSRTAAVDVSFSSISFVKPADTVFTFNPPDGAKVETISPRRPVGSTSSIRGKQASARASRTRQTPVGPLSSTGTGWTTVWTLDGDARVRKAAASLARGQLAEASTAVRGSWGSGRLFSSDLLTVLVLDDGRVLTGAVDPAALYAVAAK